MALSEKIHKLTGLSHMLLNNIEDELIYIGPDYKIKWLNSSAKKLVSLAEDTYCFNMLCSRMSKCEDCLLSGSPLGHCERNFTANTDKIIAHYSVGENYSDGVLLVFGDKNKFSYKVKPDVKDIKDNERLFHEANHDQLTSLYNRRYMDYLFELIDNNKRNEKETRLALTLLDIDEFKQINDTYGHSIGDEVLKILAYRINTEIRKTDTAIRLGGDEFLIIHTQNSEQDILGFVKRLLDQVDKPILLEDGRMLNIKISLGILLDAQNYPSLNKAINFADHALYEAKAKHGDSSHYVFFGKDLEKELNYAKELAENLDKAIRQKDFKVYYQPIICLDSNRLCGTEALIRWMPPEGSKKYTPAQFLSVAESRNSIIEIGNQLIYQVFEDINKYKRNMKRYDIISVNFSRRQLNSRNYVRLINKFAKEIDFNVQKLYIEIDEDCLLNSNDDIKRTIKSFRRLGIDIILDDFGKGCSSLSTLLEYDIKKIKIDKEIIGRISDSEHYRKLVKTLVSIAKIHDIEVFAKGVETYDQLQIVKELGCDYAQGFYLCSPKPIGKFLKYAKEHYMELNQIKLILPTN